MLFVVYGATLDMGYETRKFFREEGFEIVQKYNYVADDAKVDKDKYVNAAADENYAKWYDDGIHGGENWMKILAQKIGESYGVLLFCSEKSMHSRFCQAEFRRAIQEDKPIYTIRLDDTPMTDEFDMFLSGDQILDFSARDFEKRLIKSLPNEVKKIC